MSETVSKNKTGIWQRIRHRLFTKVFMYTLAFLAIIIIVASLIFAQQFKSFYDNSQVQRLNLVFDPLVDMLSDIEIDEIAGMADEFHAKNQSFAFSVESSDGNVLYKTRSFDESVEGLNLDPIEPDVAHIEERARTARVAQSQRIAKGDLDERVVASYFSGGVSGFSLSPDSMKTPMFIISMVQPELRLRVVQPVDGLTSFNSLLYKIILAALIMLVASVAGAAFFARGLTNPIMRLAEDTKKMTKLEPVLLPVKPRLDELGQLTGDVHSMYEKLKTTISDLEYEIRIEKEMEENQRYFFSAASHELKTPIAAASAVVEGMLSGIGDYQDHPKYLRECLKMMNAQSRIISEILDIVKLSGNNILVNTSPVCLKKAVDSLMTEFRVLAEKEGQRITVDILENVICVTDEILLRRALSNIIMNAVQNTPEGGELRIWSEQDEENQDEIRLYILNSDAQIADVDCVRLFEPFYRIDKARSRSVGKSGLGLAIVKKILDSLEIPFTLKNVGHDVVFGMTLKTAS